MGPIEKQWQSSISRRKALQGLAGFLAASPLLKGQQDPFRDHSRVPAMDELLTAFDFEAVAYAKLPSEAFQYTAHGTESEYTMRRNREAFGWVKLVPRAVADVSSVDASTEVLGVKMKYPIMLAPSSGHGALHPEGEVASHRGSSAASETPMILSSGASFRGDEIMKAGNGPMWSQLYGREKFEENLTFVDSIQAAGFKALVLTVDQTAAYYERDQHLVHLGARPNRGGRRSGGRGGGRGGAAAAAAAAEAANPYHIRYDRLWYNWPFVEKLRPYVKMPFLAKGILTAEDARLCVESGLDGIIVSNHGGRSMDYGTSTLEMLPEIVDAVAGRIPVLIDSGFRRGADVLKALALGAKAVCLGRVPRWGLASFGDEGVKRVLEIMQGELLLAMAHTGRPNLASIDRTLVRTNFPWKK
jgi:isopentenyl diphosphate isomerase/L-lactate dehydrogenase-like FMN-dependent dehydrogenase